MLKEMNEHLKNVHPATDLLSLTPWASIADDNRVFCPLCELELSKFFNANNEVDSRILSAHYAISHPNMSLPHRPPPST